jgi:hypothetical protein
MSKTKAERMQVQLPTNVVGKIKILAAQRRVSIMQWILDAAAAAYISETGLDLLEREKQAAIEADRKRVETERAEPEAKKQAEAAKLSHRRKINDEIKSLLVDFLDDETATSIIKLAAKGMLGALTVNY